MDVGNCVGQIEDPHQLHIGTQHGDPSVVVEREHCVGHDFHTLEVAELSRALPRPTHRAQELPFGRIQANLLGASIGKHQRAVRPLLYASHAEELVGRVSAGERQVDERIRVDAPVAGIAPERPQCLDDLDAGAVALDDERPAGVLACAGRQATQEENGDTVENGIRV